jgi:hypothetical protein
MAESEPGGEIGRSELRASHDDRDRVVELLRVSAGDGRLTAEELDERLEQAMTARTYGELARLVADLPAAGSAVSPATAPQAKEVARIDTRSGHVKRVERWVVPQRMEVKVTSGHVLLDFTQAVITQPTLKLDVDVRSGHVKLLTRPGIVVDADDVASPQRPRPGQGAVGFRGSRSSCTSRSPAGWAAGTSSRGRGYRNFWQWLTRQPKPYMIAAR